MQIFITQVVYQKLAERAKVNSSESCHIDCFYGSKEENGPTMRFSVEGEVFLTIVSALSGTDAFDELFDFASDELRLYQENEQTVELGFLVGKLEELQHRDIERGA